MNTYSKLMGVVCTLFASYDGVRNMLNPSYVEVGSNNMVIGPVWLMALFISVFFISASFFSINFRSVATHRLKGLVLFTLLTVFVFASGGGQFVFAKALRDVFYLAYFALVAYWFNGVFFKKNLLNFSVLIFLRWHFYSFLFLTFVAAALGKFDESDRLMGAQLTASMFGNYVPVLCFFYLVSNPGKIFGAIAVFISTVLVLMSGTRTALVVLVLLVVYFFGFYKSRKPSFQSLVPFLLVGLIVAIGSFALEGSSDGVRSLNTDDVETGSAATRFYWYETLYSAIENAGGWGGFGAGAAEAEIGYITHADYLRFWYDYGLAFAIGVFFWGIFVFFHGVRWSFLTVVDVAVFILVMVNFTLHNLFQAPNLLFETVLLGVLISKRNELVKVF